MLLPGPIGSAFAYRHVVRALVDSGFHVVVVDPLGMGQSNRPHHADYALSAQAFRVRLVLGKVLPLHVPLVVAGIGTSATIALHLAAELPERVRGVVSVAGGGNDTQATSGLRLALAFSRVLSTPPGRAFARRRFAATMRAQSSDPTWVSHDVVGAYLEHAERDVRGVLRSLQRMADSKESQPIASRLPMVHAPVLLLIGSKAGVNAPTPVQVAALTRGLRQFRVDTLDGAAAMLHEERPVAIATWIARLHQRGVDSFN
ncbi:MAG: alpha/beta hydrolase [Gemmatimonadaceae bacterium]|nr:alpha/beta hydrolase [Gemmatimonadaceae bacterium]